MNELLSERLGPDEEVEVTTEKAEVLTTAGAVGVAGKKPGAGADPNYTTEDVVVVTVYQADDPEAPSNRKPKRKSTAKKKTTAKTTARKKTTAARTTKK